MAVQTIRSTACTMPWLTPGMFKNFLNGKFRLYWHDQLLLKPMTARERWVFDEAVQNGVVIHTKSTRNAAGFYYYWCEVNCRPNIEVRPKRKYAQIEVDFISIPGSKGFSDAASCKVKALITQHQGDLKPGSWYGLGGIYTYFYIRKDKASALARTLWELALADMQSQYGDIDDPCLGERIHQDHMTRRFSGAL